MSVIFHHIEGTIAATIYALVRIFPDDLRTMRIEVIYSGELKESCDNPSPILGGQKTYYLHLTKVEKLLGDD